MKPKFIPDGLHTVTPYLMVDGAAQVIEFAKNAFAGEVLESITRPDGKIAHAQVKVGDSVVMIAECCGEMKAMPTSLYLYVPDVDAAYQRAVAAGGVSLAEPVDQFYGDRSGGVKDPSGNFWWVATHIEDVSSEELQKRVEAAMSKRSDS